MNNGRKRPGRDYKVLVVDDDQSLIFMLKQQLEQAGYEVFTAESGREALKVFFDYRPDIVILDTRMPEMDGYTLIERLREISDVPIMILSAYGEEDDVVRGLEVGADDYVLKPYRLRELLGRIRALLRRYLAYKQEPPITYQDDFLTIDLRTRRVVKGGEEIHLTPTEFRLLSALMENADQVVSNKELLNRVWGWEFRNDVDYPRIYIWHLRRKIDPDPKRPTYIRTEYGIGYRFVPQNRKGLNRGFQDVFEQA